MHFQPRIKAQAHHGFNTRRRQIHNLSSNMKTSNVGTGSTRCCFLCHITFRSCLALELKHDTWSSHFAVACLKGVFEQVRCNTAVERMYARGHLRCNIAGVDGCHSHIVLLEFLCTRFFCQLPYCVQNSKRHISSPAQPAVKCRSLVL